MTQQEIYKQLQEMALIAGKSLQSPQTGFVHYYPHAHVNEVHHPIPLYENFLFALAHLRTRTTEGITEGKNLLNKLLPFQAENGNFPLNLHEYPLCHDQYLAIHLLPCFHLILSPFSSVLGAELAQKLQHSATKLLEYALKISKESELPDTFLIKLGAAAHAFGNDEGIKLLEMTPKTADSLYWYTPTSIADVLSSLQMVYPSIANSPWKPFFEHVIQTWHLPTCSYSGPSLKEYQKFEEPQTTLYDLQLGAYTGSFSKRVKILNPIHLQAVLVNPKGDEFNSPSLPFTYSGKYQNQLWSVFQHPLYAYSVYASNEVRNRSNEQGFHPFRLIFGTKEQTHTFAMQGGNWKTISFEQLAEGIDLKLELDIPSLEEDREKQREAIFYTNLSHKIPLLVDGHTSTTFLPGQQIEIEQLPFKIKLSFLTDVSSGNFQGHLMRGNRPSQIGNKGPHRFDSYDWQIFLRTIRREHPCVIQAQLRF